MSSQTKLCSGLHEYMLHVTVMDSVQLPVSLISTSSRRHVTSTVSLLQMTERD